MKKYSVKIARYVEQFTYYEVEAESQEQAEELAMEEIGGVDGDFWYEEDETFEVLGTTITE